MRPPCDDCRRARCSKRIEVLRATVSAFVNGGVVECDDLLPTYQAFLAA